MAIEQESLIIRVGAVADASLRTVGRSFGESMEAAANRATASARKSAGAQVASAKTASAAIAAVANERANAETKATIKAADANARARQKQIKDDQKAFDERLRASAKARAAEEKDILAVARTLEREAKKKADRSQREAQNDRKRMVGDFGRGVANNISTVVRGGLGVAGQISRGFGVDLGFTGGIQRSIAAESQFSKTTISGMRAMGKTASGADIDATRATAAKAASETATPLLAMAAGLDSFVSKTGELEAGKALLADLGKTARATGTDFEDMAGLAGEIWNSFEDGDPDRVSKTLEQLRLLGVQGSKGNVEIRELAKYGSRLTAQAGMFEGSREHNVGQLGVLAQTARASGGATNAAEATRAAAAFSRDLMTKATQERFVDAGIDVWGNKEHTKLKDPQQIIKDILSYTQGDIGKTSTLMRNQIGRAPVMGFNDIYNAAGGGQKGLAAVDAEFRRLSETMSKADVESAFGTSMQSKEAKAIVFQERMDKVAASLAERLLPALERAVPHVEAFAKVMADAVAWASENPGKAITMAIVGSIAKAAIGAQISSAMGGALGPLGAATGPAASGIKALGAASIIAVAAIAGFMAINHFIDKKVQADTQRANNDVIATNTQSKINAANSGRGDPAAQAKMLEEEKKRLAGEIKGGKINLARAEEKGVREDMASGGFGAALGTGTKAALDLARLEGQMAAVEAALQNVHARLGGPLTVQGNVNVLNQPAGAGGPGQRVGPGQ